MLCFNRLTGEHNNKKYFKFSFFGSTSLNHEEIKPVKSKFANLELLISRINL